MKKIAILLVTLLFLSVSAVVNISSQTVTGSIGNGTVKRGTTARGTVVLEIPKELHVNSNKPNSEYAIETTVKLNGSGVKVGPISYPRGTDRKFQFKDEPINVYEGTVFFPFTVTVPKTYRGNTVTVKGVVRYQACTEEVCYAPKNTVVTLTARVR
jgi:DsbC/DsbD-like thiol-disulfide interchange protein